MASVGATGVTGPTGPQGVAGTPGSKWYNGPSNPPSVVTGSNIGDYYLNTSSGDVFVL